MTSHIDHDHYSEICDDKAISSAPALLPAADAKNPQIKSWRDILPVFPAAELFPRMTPEELRQLGDDIKASGMRVPITVLHTEDNKFSLLDGRNRLDALEAVGCDVIALLKACRNWKPQPQLQIRYVEKQPGGYSMLTTETVDPNAYVISTNINRRHLTSDQKGELIEALLRAKPERSDRATARIAKVDHKTVAAKRQDLEKGGEIPHQTKRVGSDGIPQPAKKPRAETKRKVANPATTAPSAPQENIGRPAATRRHASAKDALKSDKRVEDALDRLAALSARERAVVADAMADRWGIEVTPPAPDQLGAPVEAHQARKPVVSMDAVGNGAIEEGETAVANAGAEPAGAHASVAAQVQNRLDAMIEPGATPRMRGQEQDIEGGQDADSGVCNPGNGSTPVKYYPADDTDPYAETGLAWIYGGLEIELQLLPVVAKSKQFSRPFIDGTLERVSQLLEIMDPGGVPSAIYALLRQYGYGASVDEAVASADNPGPSRPLLEIMTSGNP